MIDRIGQRLGNYRIIRLVGQGGFARVYLGEHIHLKTEAAIKVLSTSLEEQEVSTFRTEAQIIARLKHRHIVRVLEFGLQEATPFLVMEYAPGGTLRDRHPGGTRLPLSVVLSYVRQIADALAYLHQQKLIHRDMKLPEYAFGERFWICHAGSKRISSWPQTSGRNNGLYGTRTNPG